MCGIVGVIDKGTRPNCKNILVDSLIKLEHRGYDSCGVCFRKNGYKEGGSYDCNWRCNKYVGAPSDGEEELLHRVSNVTPTGIGHTRWATSGRVSMKNTHPHSDKNGGSENIFVVHNGVLDNHFEIKKYLMSIFTDSEYGTQIKNMKCDSGFLPYLFTAYENQLPRFKGYYGTHDFDSADSFMNHYLLENFGSLLMVGSCGTFEQDETIYAMSSEHHPLYVGLHKDVLLISSEIEVASNIGESTNQYFKLPNNKLIKINHEMCKNMDFEIIIPHEYRKTYIPPISALSTNMAKEIYEQTALAKESLHIQLPDRDCSHPILLTGCGTSYHAALFAKTLFSTVGKNLRHQDILVEYAAEFFNNTSLLTKQKGECVAITQSGQTKDTNIAIAHAQEIGYNVTRMTNCSFMNYYQQYIAAGEEKGVAATKTLFMSLRHLYEWIAESDKYKETLSHMLDVFIDNELVNNGNIFHLANKYFKDDYIKNCVFLGTGLNYPLALEGALKLKEIAYIPSEGMPANEIKHGPIALVDEQSVCIFLYDENNKDKILQNIQEVIARNGKIIVIIDEADIYNVSDLTENIIRIPHSPYKFNTHMLNLVALQIFAFTVSKCKNLNVDKPKNLAKVITV